jgi:peptide/nickel transport system ATP-binding protein
MIWGDTERVAMIEVKHLQKWYPVHAGMLAGLMRRERQFVRAVDNVSFAIAAGEMLGLAGESGSGKTTTGELLVRLQDPTAGEILVNGENVAFLEGPELKRFRNMAQVIFQDPYQTLNPRFTVLHTILEPLRIHHTGARGERLERVIDALHKAELRPADTFLHRFPHQLSGGQRQRVAIARAIVLQPQFIVADEPVSMLDVSIRAGILNLLRSLKEQMGLTMLYITHDLSTLRYICTRTAIMYLGRIAEIGPTEAVIDQAHHPYTQALIAAVPRTDPDVRRPAVRIEGEIPDPIDLPHGCRFRPRCNRAFDACFEEPELQEVAPGHHVACHLY